MDPVTQTGLCFLFLTIQGVMQRMRMDLGVGSMGIDWIEGVPVHGPLLKKSREN